MIPTADSRRRWLLRTGAKALAAIGLLAFAGALLSSLVSTEPDTSELVYADAAGLAPGEVLLTEWERRQVLVLHRTPAMLESLSAGAERVADPDSRRSRQPEAARNAYRSLRPQYLVAVAHGTDVGCAVEYLRPGDPRSGAGAPGGFRDICRGSLYDLAGRVLKEQAAYRNLEVPPHRDLGDGRIAIGGG